MTRQTCPHCGDGLIGGRCPNDHFCDYGHFGERLKAIAKKQRSPDKQRRDQAYQEWRQRRMIQLWQGREDDDHE